MNCLELEEKVFALAELAEWDNIDRTDAGMTISIAMNDEQRNDLAAMIDFFESRKDTPSSIMANVMYDLCGLRAVHFGEPHGNCFSPRSSGYAKRVAALE